jgi:SAM-dependent methyltransferase
VDRDEQRRVRLEDWSSMATGWERARQEREKVGAPVTEWLVRELAPKPGETVPDPAAALAETRRVLRSGGRLACSVWASGDRNPWISAAARILVAHGYMPPPEPGEPGMFVLGDEELLRRLVENAGFANVRTEEVPVRNDYPSVDEYVSRSSEMGGMFSRAWAAAPEEEQERLKGEFRTAFSPFAVDGGYELPGVSLCVVAS